ncbi:MAG: hypothetical protein DRI23_02985 [Candidatus Cloacimonadota bacterium]|nr:MAG: hypothetical protein DRH79_07445 [Candidatus Cloacimonadota bacterium]RLC52379.1 MAG: hypothetical protein DRI23_02985 [Candidatus Cloacimonadota bacterium]
MKIILTSLLVFILQQLPALIISIPDDFSSIQVGIEQSTDGDTVLVAPGTYFENLNFDGKNILLTSNFLFENNQSYIEQTIIDGSTSTNPDTNSVVVFCNNETASAVIQGFTITGGGGTVWIDPQLPALTWFSGGGIFMYYSSPTIRYNLITENNVENTNNYDGASGGGLLCFRGNPLIHNNTISLNQADYGAGVVVDYSGAVIKNNLVINNSGGELYGGGGLYVIGSDIEPIQVINNTIFGNHSETDGGAIKTYSSPIIALNNIIWGNTQVSGNQINGGGSISITYCCVEGGFTGTGNIDADPLFVDDYYLLSSNSPCIDAGYSGNGYFDLEDPDNSGYALYPSQGTILNDMGVYGGPLTACFQPTSIELNTIHASKINLSNYPNPFNPTTTISFNLIAKDAKNAKLTIYNLKGNKIRQYPISNNQSSIVWDGTEKNNQQVPSGIYFYSLNTGSIQQTRKMILIK